jgi:hypothetical protein
VRRLAIATAVILAAVVFFLLATLPPRPAVAQWGGDPSIPGRTVGGAYHVHTTRSDGAAGKAEVAAAAARAGLQFVLFTEHGDGTTPPDPPAYLSGVLCLDSVEISTNGGHYTALDLPQTPYPLGGEADTVVEDVRRLGGFGFIAHPDSPRSELAWTDWTLPFDGVEWMNADSEWRNEPQARMLRVLFDYLVRPAPALASLFDRPVMTLTRWDALTTRRPVLAMAGHDAHGGFGIGTEGGGWWGVPIPSYESSFRTFSTRVVLDAPFSGDAAADARALIDAIRAGRMFTAIEAMAAPGFLDFRLDDGRLVAEASMPPGAEIVVLHADGPVIGREVVRAGTARHVVAALRGAYRVEVRVPSAPGDPPMPWIVSNALSVGLDAVAPVPAPAAPALARVPWPSDPTLHVEHDPSTTAHVEVEDGQVSFTFALGGEARNSQFAAAALDMPHGMPALDAISFEAHASRPMRVSVQVRFEGEDIRWGRSVYLDETPKPVTVLAEDLLPIGSTEGRMPPPAAARALLVVVDLVNARPGDQGRVELFDVAVSRR